MYKLAEEGFDQTSPVEEYKNATKSASPPSFPKNQKKSLEFAPLNASSSPFP